MLKRYCVGAAICLVALAGCASKEQKAEDPLKLIQSKRGAALSIQDRLLFDVGSAALQPASAPVMDRVASIVKAKPNNSILIEGHTDNVGSREYNQNLSGQRALTVKQALVARGIEAKRLATKGYGFAEPVEANDNPGGRQANRRAEIVFPGETVESLAKVTKP